MPSSRVVVGLLERDLVAPRVGDQLVEVLGTERQTTVAGVVALGLRGQRAHGRSVAHADARAGGRGQVDATDAGAERAAGRGEAGLSLMGGPARARSSWRRHRAAPAQCFASRTRSPVSYRASMAELSRPGHRGDVTARRQLKASRACTRSPVSHHASMRSCEGQVIVATPPRGAPASGSLSESERGDAGTPSGPARSAEDRGAHR